MSKRFGDPVGPSYRTRVGNALYEYAGWPPDQINYFLDQVEREHAHELAEKIRNDREPWEWALAGQHAGNDAADLIDPEVQ